MPKILIKTGEKKGQVFNLSKEKVFIGRDFKNTIVLPDTRVSRSHACIALQGEDFILEDLGSVNGSSVNNKDGKTFSLKVGDEIKLGSTVMVFLSMASSENADVEHEAQSRVNILSQDETPKGLTVELTLPSNDSSHILDIGQGDVASLKKAYQRLTALYRISHELGTITDLQNVLNKVLKIVLDIMKADRGFILLVDEESKELVPQVVHHKDDIDQTENVAISKTIINQIIESGESIITSDAMTDDRFKNSESIVFHGIRSTMCVPLKFEGKVLGLMSVDSKGKEVNFTKDDLELLTAICDQASVVIKNAKLFDDLKKAHKELKAQQSQLIESEKLSAIGQLSSGVAHEINNPLTSVLGYSELSVDKLKKESISKEDLKECAEFMKIVQEEAQHCKRIAQDLLSFSRRTKDEMALIDINKAVDAALVIAKFHIKKVPIELKVKLDPNLPKVMGDINQLQQVFLNMIVNARDAMEEGGQINIKTSKGKDGLIEAKFSDSGCGIPEDKLEEIFKPLYTSKEEGKGTGLGLSISHDIVEKHKGRIEVESKIGKGTTFIIKIPAGQ